MDCCNVGCSNVVQVQDLETTTWSRVDCWRDWISWSSPLPSSAPPIIAPTSTLVRPPYMLFYWPPYILFYWPPCMYVCINTFFIGHHTDFFIATIHAALPFYLPVLEACDWAFFSMYFSNSFLILFAFNPAAFLSVSPNLKSAHLHNRNNFINMS